MPSFGVTLLQSPERLEGTFECDNVRTTHTVHARDDLILIGKAGYEENRYLNAVVNSCSAPALCSETLVHAAPSPSDLPSSQINVTSVMSFGVQTKVGRIKVVSISPTSVALVGLGEELGIIVAV